MNISFAPTRSAISPSERLPQPGLSNWNPEVVWWNERVVKLFNNKYLAAGAGGTTVIGRGREPRHAKLHLLAPLVLALLRARLGPVALADDPPPAPPAGTCLRTWGETRARAYGYDHFVIIDNACPKVATCVVKSSINPTPTEVTVAAKSRVEVVAGPLRRRRPSRPTRPAPTQSSHESTVLSATYMK